ncbi:hypothetical protein LCGC14_1678920 [marine sediment metagenome]|uniref:Uncharacterized protein n=1 Tax=marine sediment metagenome TaxID=412755 RepID=A0A0F9HPB4_9ZZZZ
MEKEDKSFEKFVAICYVLGFVSLLGAGFVWVFGIPNFSNLDEQRVFCFENGGMPIELARVNYNQMICLFMYNKTAVEYVASEITNEDWAEYFGYEVRDYCFTCWDSQDCASPHNDILREKGVHC